jgi:hypothetical protein
MGRLLHGRDLSPMEMISTYTLGPLPWSEEVLRQAYFRNFIHAQKAIQEHPGFVAHDALCALQLSLDIFLDAVSELFQSTQAFRIDAQSPEFWTRPAQSRFHRRELAVRRGVFTAATSALALVDASRRIRKKIMVVDYDVKRSAMFSEEHVFIQKLRNYVSHYRMIEPAWQRSFSATERRTQFLLRPNILLQWDGWEKARAFINRYPDGIDVEELFKEYQTCVERFYAWFRKDVARVSEPQLSEYRGYEKMLKRFGTRALWNLLLEQVTTGHLDPFPYLDRYLTRTELDEVLSLPTRSRIQVDRIIEILDEYGACDEELRKKAYRAFGVEIPHCET